MITTTEDKFDVDYDIFSFTGRAAMIAGGIYALDKSLRDNTFKKTPKNFGRLNNDFVNKLADVISKDNVEVEPIKLKEFNFKNDSFFKNIDSPQKPHRINSVFDTLKDSKGNIKVDLLSDLDGGYKGMSSSLFDELDALQETIMTIDNSSEFSKLRNQKSKGNFQSGSINVLKDKTGKINSISIDSLGGKFTIPIVSKNGMMTIDSNRYFSRPQFNADGLKASKPYGLDVAMVRFINENYKDIILGKISHDEILTMLNSGLVYAGKNYGDTSKMRIDEKVAQNILGSAKEDVFSPMGSTARTRVLKDAEVNGLGIPNATSLNQAIIRQSGDAISEIDGLRYTSNAYQIFRANTFAIGRDGKPRTGIITENIAFMDDAQLDSLKEVFKHYGVSDFGDLAKEELIANKNFLEVVGDNSRAVSFRNDSIADAGDFLLNKALKITGMSKDNFQLAIQKAGFDAFEEPIRKQLKEIGLDDYAKHLREEMQKSRLKRKALLSKRQAYLDTNSYSPALQKERRELIAKRDMYKKVNKGKDLPVFFEKNKKGILDSKNFARAEILKKQKNLDKEIQRIEARLKQIRREGITPKKIKNPFFKEALNIRGRGGSLQDEMKKITSEITEIDKYIEEQSNKLKTSNILGLSKDKREAEIIKSTLKNLKIDNMFVSDDGLVTFELLREFGVDQGVKVIDPSGEIKAVVKTSVGDLGEYIFRSFLKSKGLNWQGKNNLLQLQKEAVASGKVTQKEIDEIYSLSESTYAIAKKEAMKKDVTDRNLYDVIHSVRQQNAKDKNQKVSKILSEFDSSNKTDADYEKLIRSLNNVSGGDITNIMGTSSSAGFFKSKMFSLGSTAEDLGAGKAGFVSGRHIKLMVGLGLENFASDVMSRKITNQGAVRSYINLQKTQMMLADSTKAGFIKISDFAEDIDFYRFMDDVFPSVDDDFKTNTLDRRIKGLSKYGKVENGAFFVDLGQEIEGVRKIPIFADKNLDGFIGDQIGFEGDYKKYTQIDRLAKDILSEARRGEKDSEKLKQMMVNYKAAIAQLDSAFQKKMLKAKVKGSMLGQATSGSAALNSYADEIFGAKSGIKHSAPYVAAVSKKQFNKLFGPKAYEAFLEDRKGGKASRFWAFMTREPVEGLSGLPVNVVPAEAFEGITELSDKRIALVANRTNSLLNMVFGDYDGDQLSLVSAQTDESTEEIRRLAMSNDPDALAYRFSQEAKTKIKLKEQLSKSILHNDLASLRLSAFHAKELEKTFVGIASKSLESLHTVNQKINFGNKAKFAQVESLLHIFAENIIKAKAQSADDLINRKAQTILDALVGGQEFKNASMGDRIKQFRGFVDHITLGEAADLGDQIRSQKKSGKVTQDLRNEIIKRLGGGEKATIRAAEILDEDWFTHLTADEAMENIMEVSGLSAKGVENTTDAIRNTIDKELGDSRVRILKQIEQTQEAMKDTKKMMQGLGGNLAKYALLPAALFGVAGTVFGARSSINSEVEFSDNKRQHDKSGLNIFKPRESINFNKPRHIKPEIRGSGSSGFQINKYSATHQVSEVRLTDDTMNFDYYDMQDKMKRGY